MVARFRRRVEESSSSCVLVDSVADLLHHVSSRGDVVAIAPSTDARQPSWRRLLEEAGATVVIPSATDPAAQVADVPVALVQAELGIAETGSLLVSEHALADRVTTLLSRVLVLVVERDQIRPRLEDAAEWLTARPGPGFASLMTGPSRTADIERSLTIGVQGAQEVDVVVLR